MRCLECKGEIDLMYIGHLVNNPDTGRPEGLVCYNCDKSNGYVAPPGKKRAKIIRKPRL